MKRDDVIGVGVLIAMWGGLFFLGWLLHTAKSQPCPVGTRTIEGWQAGRYTHLCVSESTPLEGLEVKP